MNRILFDLRPLCAWRLRDYLIAPFAFVLGFLCARNFALRMQGRAPDQWYWADKLLMRFGWVIALRVSTK